jgi:excisionase family DNA binding protein
MSENEKREHVLKLLGLNESLKPVILKQIPQNREIRPKTPRLKRTSNVKTLAELSELLTVVEAAKYLKVHPDTIRKWIASGELRVIRFGRGSRQQVRIPIDAIEEMYHAV